MDQTTFWPPVIIALRVEAAAERALMRQVSTSGLYKGKEMGEGERVVKGEMKRWRDREGGADIGEEREGKRSEGKGERE